MLVGPAGSRKSRAIKTSAKFLKAAKFSNLAADSTSREQFFEDFASQADSDTLECLATGMLDETDKEIAETFTRYTVVADEFTDFAGVNNINMYNSLGNLWDYIGVFKYRPKHGKKVAIINPILNILAGTTAESFAASFPANTLKQGLVSRTLLINSGKIRRKLYWPEAGDPEVVAKLVDKLTKLKDLKGELQVSPAAKVALKAIYENWENIEDSRFASYASRRYSQLLKLCIIVSAARGRLDLNKDEVIEANSILTYAEKFMPDALGEYGMNKGSPVVGSILEFVKYHPETVVSQHAIYRAVATDVRDLKECRDILMNLVASERLQITAAGLTYIHRNSGSKSNESLYCDFNLLKEIEK
jgi:hypothetical protein